jgi:hypothetical protein
MTRKRTITVIKSAVSVHVRLALDVVRGQLGELAVVAGPHLAAQIHAYVERERLGYYPALEFLVDSPQLDKGLVAAVQQIALFSCEYAKTEVQRRLWPVFSHVEVRHTQAHALMLPNARPNQSNSLALLTEHYTPNRVRLDLTLSSLEKSAETEGLERLAAQKVTHWLRESFETVEITDTRPASG